LSGLSKIKISAFTLCSNPNWEVGFRGLPLLRAHQNLTQAWGRPLAAAGVPVDFSLFCLWWGERQWPLPALFKKLNQVAAAVWRVQKAQFSSISAIKKKQ
jgi:hypothetical protein